MSNYEPVPKSPVRMRSKTIPLTSNVINDNGEMNSSLKEADIEINTVLTKNNIEKITADLQNIKGCLESLKKQRDSLNDRYIEQMSSGLGDDPDMAKNFKRKIKKYDAKIRENNETLLTGNYILNHLKTVGIPKGIADKEYSKLLLKYRNANLDNPRLAQREILKILSASSGANSEVSSGIFQKDSALDKSTDSINIPMDDDPEYHGESSIEVKTMDSSSLDVSQNPTGPNFTPEPSYDNSSTTPLGPYENIEPDQGTGATSLSFSDESIKKNISSANLANSSNNSKVSPTGQFHTSSSVPLMKMSTECQSQLEFLDQLLTFENDPHTTINSHIGHSANSCLSPSAGINSGSNSGKKSLPRTTDTMSSTNSGQATQSHRAQFLNQVKTGFGTFSRGIKRRTLDIRKTVPLSTSLEDLSKANNHSLELSTTVSKGNHDDQDEPSNSSVLSYPLIWYPPGMTKSPGSSGQQSQTNEEIKETSSNRSQRSDKLSTTSLGRPRKKHASSSSQNNPQFSSDSNFNSLLNGQMKNVDETMLKLWSLCGITPRPSGSNQVNSNSGKSRTGGSIIINQTNPRSGASCKSTMSCESANCNNNQLSNNGASCKDHYSLGPSLIEVNSDLSPIKLSQAFTIIYHLLTNCSNQIDSLNNYNLELQEKVQILSNDLNGYSSVIHHLKHDLTKLRDDFDMKFEVNRESFNNILTRIESLSATAEETRHELKRDNLLLKDEFSRTSEKLNYQLNMKTRDLNDIITNIQNKFPIMEQRFEQLTMTSNDLSPSRLIVLKLAELFIGCIVLLNTLFQLIIRTLNAGATLTDNRFISIFINFIILFLILSTLFKDYLPDFRVANMTLVNSFLKKKGE